MLWIAQRLHAPSILGVLLSLVLASPMAAALPAATATDCSRATTREEKLICTTPQLRAADAAMAKAYSVLQAELPRAQQSALLSDQRNWLGLRGGIKILPTGAPVVESDRDLVARLLKETDERRGFLAGEGPNRASDAPRLRPVFIEDDANHIVYPRIAKPRSASERDFNKEVQSIATGAYPGPPPPPPAGSNAIWHGSYQVSYVVTYLGPRLAAVVFTVSDLEGDYEGSAAHPQEGRTSLIFDFSRGRALTMADIIASPAKAFPAIAERCKTQLAARPGNEVWDILHADISVDDLKSWAPDKSGVDILFDPFSIDGNAFGFQECRLSWADLSPWLKPGGPLPPH
jgi:uncharacterized protein YecT (DUF1311 family)